MDLIEEFRSQILWGISESEKIGYSPNRIKQEIETKQRDPVQFAKQLVISGEFQTGFRQINRLGRPEITIEYIMLKPEFETLFSEAERKAARWRLDNWDSIQ